MPDQLVGTQELNNFDLQVKFFTAALAAVPNSRVYALDDIGRRGGVALLRSLLDLTGRSNIAVNEMSALLVRVATREPSLVQSWRPGPVPPPPVPWRDEVTGEMLPNPFADPVDRVGQGILIALDSRLAEHLKAMAENPYGRLAWLKDETTRRAQLAVLSYKASPDHRDNPFRTTDIDAQGLFAQTQPAYFVAVWKAEAAPARMPWSSDSKMLNRTINGFLIQDFDSAPYFDCSGELFRRAAGIDAALVEEMQRQASDDSARAQERANELARAARR